MKYKLTLLLFDGRELTKIELFDSKQEAIKYASDIAAELSVISSYSVEEVV